MKSDAKRKGWAKAFKEMAKNGDDKLIIPDFFDDELKPADIAEKKSNLTDYFGKLKGAFGDGLTYQKNIRE